MSLRWILLLLAVVLIAVVYLVSRRQPRNVRPRIDPAFDSHAIATEVSQTALSEQPDSGIEPLKNDPDKASVTNTGLEALQNTASISGNVVDGYLVLNLLAAQNFVGKDMYQALIQHGFQRNAQGVFANETEHGTLLAVNALKPGVFPEEAAAIETNAIALILDLNDSQQPSALFEDLINIAQQLQNSLGARLCDAQRSSVTTQTLQYLRDAIQQYQLQHQQHASNSSA